MGFEFILLSIRSIHRVCQRDACTMTSTATPQYMHISTNVRNDKHNQTNEQSNERSRGKKLQIALALASEFIWIFYVADDQMWEIDYVIGVHVLCVLYSIALKHCVSLKQYKPFRHITLHRVHRCVFSLKCICTGGKWEQFRVCL